MIKTSMVVILGSFLVLGAGCGGSSDSDGQVSISSTQKTYNLTEEGCSTGSQTFSSLAEYCDGLKSRSRNQNCAYSLRRLRFENECSGAFVETT